MKIRNGFVSNSSSSSFIVGVGKISNRDAFDEFIKEKGICNFVDIYTTEELVKESESDSWYKNCTKSDDKYYITKDSFMDSGERLEFDPNLNEEFVVVSYCGDEGECSFCSNDPDNCDYDCGYSNYNIDSEFFEGDSASYLFDLSDHGVENYSYHYGAGRNG
jgi:hypothetical protein